MSGSSSKSALNPLAAAAGKVPPGISAHDRLSSYNGVPMTAVLGVLATIALTFYFIRVYTKVFIIRRAGWDDRKLCPEFFIELQRSKNGKCLSSFLPSGVYFRDGEISTALDFIRTRVEITGA